MMNAAIPMEGKMKDMRIRALDNGGFVVSCEVKKKNPKENEYQYENKEYGYENMDSMFAGLKEGNYPLTASIKTTVSALDFRGLK